MKAFILAVFLFFSHSSFAVMDERLFHLYGALGEAYSFSSVRIGHKDWELGRLNAQSVGLVKQIYKGNIYAGFGLAIIKNIGFHGSLGFDLPFWKIYSLRGELNTSNDLSNYTHGEALIGLTFHI